MPKIDRWNRLLTHSLGDDVPLHGFVDSGHFDHISLSCAVSTAGVSRSGIDPILQAKLAGQVAVCLTLIGMALHGVSIQRSAPRQ